VRLQDAVGSCFASGLRLPTADEWQTALRERSDLLRADSSLREWTIDESARLSGGEARAFRPVLSERHVVSPAPELVQDPLIALGERLNGRRGWRSCWYVEKKLAHNPSAYQLVVERERTRVNVWFGERDSFRIWDYDTVASVLASTVEDAAAAIERLMDRLPRLSYEPPSNARQELLDVVHPLLELAPEAEILWDREGSLIVESAVCHFSELTARYGIGIAKQATHAYWADTPREAAEAIVKYAGLASKG
jgi:hypothetical protein